jgi:hypothetical protein
MNDTALTEQQQGPAPAAQGDSTGMVAMIERFANSPDVDVSKLEKMLDMQERIMNRNAETAFNGAMAELQGELPTITENDKIVVKGETRSTYATFEHINEQVKPILQRHGFAVTFKTETNESSVKVIGILTHRDGHRETTDMVLPLDNSGQKNTVQMVGSSVSYGKRYVLCALLNISTGGEDDDGQGADAVQPVLRRMEQAESQEQLKAIFAQAWKEHTSSAARQRLTEVKDLRKEELSNG